MIGMMNGMDCLWLNRRRLKPGRVCAILALEQFDVIDPETMQPVPRDGKTLGEVMFRGNVVMKGYFKNQVATQKPLPGVGSILVILG